jgi:hypothetical protein
MTADLVHLANLALSFVLGGICALLFAGLASTWPDRIRRRTTGRQVGHGIDASSQRTER